MPNNKWDDENIENLLRDFPKIEDKRTKEQVQTRLFPPAKRKKPKRWLPLLAAALVFLTVGTLLALMITQNDGAMDQSATEDSEALMTDSESSGGEEGEQAFTTQSDEAMEETAEDTSEAGMPAEAAERTAVYSGDLNGMVPLTIGLTENAFVIPVTFLIPEEWVREDFPDGEWDAVGLYEQYAAEIDESALGFDDYHPYRGSLSQSGDGVEHTLPADHTYDLASAAINVYIESLAATFSGAEAISVLDENGSAAEFDQVGTVEPFAPGIARTAYYGYSTAGGGEYLVPDRHMAYSDAEQALLALVVSPNDFQRATVPEGVQFTVEETADNVTIRFEPALDFDGFHPSEAIRMIESMTLTAASFGKELSFENTAQQQWNGFDFTAELPVPAAPNRMEWQQ